MDRFAVHVPGVPKACLFDGKRQFYTSVQRWINPEHSPSVVASLSIFFGEEN
jgi:hypothetical protein